MAWAKQETGATEYYGDGENYYIMVNTTETPVCRLLFRKPRGKIINLGSHAGKFLSQKQMWVYHIDWGSIPLLIDPR